MPLEGLQVPNIDESQRKAARVVGVAYLLAIAPALFAEFYVANELIADAAAETAKNILAHERLFRLGIASNVLMFAIEVVLIASLYVVLKPINRNAALIATFWRLIGKRGLKALLTPADA